MTSRKPTARWWVGREDWSPFRGDVWVIYHNGGLVWVSHFGGRLGWESCIRQVGRFSGLPVSG